MTDQSRPRVPLWDRQSVFREQEILRTTEELVRELGCRAITMDKIARRLGISKGTLYRHFAGRDDLLRRAVDGPCRAALGEARAIAEQSPPGEALRDAASHLVYRCLGLGTRGAPSRSPCCLGEVECPYIDWAELERFLQTLSHDPKPSDPPVSARVLFALSASAVSRVRREGGRPTQEDAVGVLRYVLPQSD